ncbi:2-keto-4-pentenoate hydratase [Ureibacillus manganicus]|uniref:4-oxalocrotonate decarboxylase n=1 Tax=Ureibacillus manganicus DSM 26584 TaxID=1384049 RepID=A0A0A3I5A6_9BACL|nr:fumarylacetoacetate hydrolase family protein [Ureibacillus manganicus]KGR79981.1 4-oxalocrotonate decarboxylase [Ureibacillus manganicus DSM 26584]
MLKVDVQEEISNILFHAEKNRTDIKKFVDQYPELTIDVAYTIQERLIEKKCFEEKTEISGWKLGLTSKAKQRMMGVHEPSYGVLLQNMELHPGEPISIAPFIHAKIEPEIAFVMKKDLGGPVVTVADVLDATDYVIAAMEIIDSRYENFNFTLPDVIADNSSSSRYILGTKKHSVKDIDLERMGCVFKKNGQVCATTTAASIMGNPARAITWMANKLISRGKKVQAGEIILSGALTGAETLQKDDTFLVRFDGLDGFEVTFTE